MTRQKQMDHLDDMTNMQLNRIPDAVATVHLIAACGTAMGALACILKDRGIVVTGSDQNVYPPMSTFLAENGISVAEGFAPEHLSYEPDLVVVGNTVSRDNPEVRRMVEMGLPFCSLPQALDRFLVCDRHAVLVTGTHGKTTTASLMAWVLMSAGRDPSFMIGGIVRDFNRNYRLGNGSAVVIEGDEYDTAFFDKGPKFLHYHPKVAILTSVEFDHADIFNDLDHVRSAFQRMIARMPADSLLVACTLDDNIPDLIRSAACRLTTYGLDAGCDWQLTDLAFAGEMTTFSIRHRGRPYGDFRTPLLGRHNALNALSVIAAAHDMGIPKAAVARALESFSGVRRRQEIRGRVNGVTVVDDFAHHPTAVRETIRAVKPVCGNGRLIAVFEPRTNSSMRDVFQETYTRSFDDADLVCIRKPPLLHKVPEGHRLAADRLVAELRQLGADAWYFEDTDAIVDFLAERCVPGDVVLIMSNGGFDGIHQTLMERLARSG